MPEGVLRGGGGYEPAVAYGQSKTANLLFSVELNRIFGSRGLGSWAVSPGSKSSVEFVIFRKLEIVLTWL